MTVPMRILYGGSLLALGAGLLLVAASLFATGRVTGFDAAILVWVRERTGDHGPLIVASHGATMMGNNLTLWIVTAIGLAYLASRQRWRLCAYLASTAAGGAIIVSVLKALVDRPRPMIVAHLVDVRTASFPSGHAMDSAFVYGSLAIVMAAQARRGRRATVATSVAMLLIFAIGASRIILGVHWPTDVAAGWAIGLGWTAIVTQIFVWTNNLNSAPSSWPSLR
ncbi:phosphatase PAP2 family protein [Sphingomonas sp. Leaf257]|nr:phosphatase PAP2 family protein [Sphingomonas sp. Leaf257]